MPRTPAPANGEALSNDPLEVAREVFRALDDAFGRLECAIRVMDILTEGKPENAGVTALFDKQKEVDEMVQNAWPVVMGSATE